jgi:hypothetical protein
MYFYCLFFGVVQCRVGWLIIPGLSSLLRNLVALLQKANYGQCKEGRTQKVSGDLVHMDTSDPFIFLLKKHHISKVSGDLVHILDVPLDTVATRYPGTEVNKYSVF